MNKNIYETDFYGWTLVQSSLLKERNMEKLDYENLIEEIESMGRSEKSKLRSHLSNLLTHMLKVRFQPDYHTLSWDLSIKNARLEAKETLEENPSLKPKLKEIFKNAYKSAKIKAATETQLSEKTFPQECPWTIEEIMEEKEE
jgi:uncharacterized protein DUF29